MQSSNFSKISVQEVVMKSLMNFFYCSSLLLLSLILTSCITESKTPKENPAVVKDSLESVENNKAAVEAVQSCQFAG